MRNVIITAVLLLVLAGGYYFYKSSQAKAKTLKLQTHKEAIDTLRKNDSTAIPIQYAKILPDSTLKILKQYNLASLWANPDTAFADANRFDGFYGTDHYRIEMFFSEVRQDTELPHTFYVKGKSRFKKNITPFSGEIKVESISILKDPNIAMDDMDAQQVYTLKGSFQLKEDSTRQGSGIFAGNVFMDFSVSKTEEPQLWFFTPSTAAQGGGFKFQGNWTSNKTQASKPVIWAKDLFMFANNILKNFSIGERDVEINPKYRHLGWDNYWEFEEWWVDTKPLQ
ncbi:MAG: hypothetical protein U0Y10_03745 [Spirosomataceae bacterium]